MLIIKRRLGEAVRLNDLRITVVEIQKGQGSPGSVKLGIEAGQHIKIAREELLRREAPQ